MGTKQKAAKKSAKFVPGPKKRRELEVEGELTVSYHGGAPCFVVDDSHLSELAIFHFKPPIDDEGVRRFGRMKILIIPVNE